MKNLFYFLSIALLITSCVSNSKGVPVEIQVLTDDFAIEQNLSTTSITYYITPKLLKCNEPLKLQPQVSINRLSGEENTEFKVEFHKNFFQNLFEANIDEEKGKKLLAELEIPKEWKTNHYQNASNAILNFLQEQEDNIIILTDKQYDSLPLNNQPIFFKNEEEFNGLLKQFYCEDELRPHKIIILHNLKSFSQDVSMGGKNGGSETAEGEKKEPIKITDPCTQKTVTDGLDLKEDLLQIIDTKNTYKERDQLARETWKKYFDPMASVTFYVKANQKYPEGFFESGDGANYFIDRLAYMSSITEVNIIRIEYHNDTHKISGIVVVECHNASEIQ